MPKVTNVTYADTALTCLESTRFGSSFQNGNTNGNAGGNESQNQMCPLYTRPVISRCNVRVDKQDMKIPYDYNQ